MLGIEHLFSINIANFPNQSEPKVYHGLVPVVFTSLLNLFANLMAVII